MTKHPMEIGGAGINKHDPYALTERIQFMVRHEMPFTEFADILEDLVPRNHEYDWSVYEKFIELLKRYRQALEEGSVHANEMRDQVVEFSAHRETKPGSPSR